MDDLLVTHNLNLSIANKTICQGLHLKIPPGTVWGFIARNGTGKTTLLHTLAGLQKTYSGQITLLGKPLPHFSPKEKARALGILFQKNNPHFPQSVYEYCRSGRYPHMHYFPWHNPDDHSIIMRALVDMELERLAESRVTELSGGELQRLNMATLLVQKPQLYLLDEPMNHLDLYYQIKMLDHIKGLCLTGASFIMTLHDIHYAANYCHQLLMLFEDGTFLSGNTQDVLTMENLARLYHLKNNTIHKINDKIAEYLNAFFNK